MQALVQGLIWTQAQTLIRIQNPPALVQTSIPSLVPALAWTLVPALAWTLVPALIRILTLPAWIRSL